MSEKKKRLQIFVLMITGALIAWVTVFLFLRTGDRMPMPEQSSQNPTDRHLYPGTPGAQNDVQNRIDIYLYFSNKDNSFLSAEKRNILHPDDSADFGRKIIHELIEGSLNKLVRTIPEKTVLNAFYVSDDGTAYADFSQEIKEHHPGGSQSEYLTVYSVVNSIVYNVPDIKAVKILINGNEAMTLAGHIELRSPIRANMVMVR
ncbi:MAG: GerMN domain-containing protein [Deltaproteobacteria bacterium]|nr:GerMN domain-containing protein [Deltaproteobacteria bacterium]MBW2218124.1 GerMN domain-containing protein [Deltaproteobacteria bacterium]